MCKRGKFEKFKDFLMDFFFILIFSVLERFLILSNEQKYSNILSRLYLLVFNLYIFLSMKFLDFKLYLFLKKV